VSVAPNVLTKCQHVRGERRSESDGQTATERNACVLAARLWSAVVQRGQEARRPDVEVRRMHFVGIWRW
jgi:hypothetical protein